NNGADIALVSKRLGHKSIQTTLSHYAFLLPEADQKMAETMEQAVANAARRATAWAARWRSSSRARSAGMGGPRLRICWLAHSRCDTLEPSCDSDLHGRHLPTAPLRPGRPVHL